MTVADGWSVEMSGDRRRSRRVASSCRCWIVGESRALYAVVRNINRGGIFVAGVVPFQVGEEVSIRIEGAHPGASLVARSRVIWSRQDEEGMGIGAEFLEITAGRQLLEQLLSEGE
jgi:Tfp pilus assembly protein PilZ